MSSGQFVSNEEGDVAACLAKYPAFCTGVGPMHRSQSHFAEIKVVRRRDTGSAKLEPPGLAEIRLK